MLISELDALQENLNSALDTIRAELKVAGLPEFSNFVPSRHPLDNPGALTPPKLYEARRLALACAGQLKNLLQAPYEKAVEQSCAVYETACLDIVVKTGVIDALGDPSHLASGLHVRELHQKLDLSPQRLTTILRYLATQGWVHERELDVFALNRPALELLSGRNGRNWVMTTGKPKIAASLIDFLAYSTDDDIFAYLKRHPSELAQWSSSVRSMGDAYEAGLLTDYPWKSLKSKFIVDVGGGQGALTLSLARILPKCRLLVQDLPEVISLARENVKCSAVQDGRIQLQVHDIFHVQPKVTEATTYILRYILHNWPDEDCIKILQNIRLTAQPESKILIIETVVVPATVSLENPIASDKTTSTEDADATYKPMSPPYFVPSNFGVHAKMPLALGVHMMAAFNAYERTLPEWEKIIHGSGLKIEKVRFLRAFISVIECSIQRGD